MSYKPPIEVQGNARKALEVRARKPMSQRAMTDVGLARARDLSTGRPQSLDTIKRMKAFFDRHGLTRKRTTGKSAARGGRRGWDGAEMRDVAGQNASWLMC